MSTIRGWSHSRLTTFEQCKLRAKLAYLDKIPEPPRDLPPGRTEHANDRGQRIHDGAELFIKGNVELLPELMTFKDEFFKLRELYRDGVVDLEGEWGFDQEWMPTAWMSSTTWARVKLDAFVRIDEHAIIIDYKTGKRFGNEIKHAEQGQIYQLAAFLRFPELEVIDVEFWYTDLNELHHMRFTRDQGLRFFTGINNRAIAMTSETEFPPRPSIFTCKWCPYGPAGTGHCQKGIQGAGAPNQSQRIFKIP